MSEDTRESATCGDSLLPKPTSPESEDASARLDEVADEKKALASPDSKAEVKFVSADSRNGDAILDIENVRSAFTGMGKEELMKFANDPFWVRTRWVLFVSFWALWVAMVAGAIAIIVFAPKCAPPKPRRWWEQSPLLSLDSLTPIGKDNVGKVEGVENFASNLSKVGIDGIILPPVFDTGSSNIPEAVVNFKAIKSDFGTVDDFRKSLANLKKSGVRVIMEIAPGHTSKEHDWFKQSAKKVDRYKDYYIWVDSAQRDKLQPLGKWSNDWSQASFVWNDDRGAFYLRQSARDLPVLNLTNPDVISEFEDIFRFWLDLGVSGFQTRDSSSLIANARWVNLPNEIDINDNRTDVASVVKQLRAIVTNHTADHAFILSGDVQSARQGQHPVVLGDALYSPTPIFTIEEEFTAVQLKNKIEAAMNASATKWPVWDVLESQAKSSRLSPGLVDGLLMTAMLLPGTPVLHRGNLLDLSVIGAAPAEPVSGEVQPRKSEIQNRAEVFKELSNVRKTMVAFNFGDLHIHIVNSTDNVEVLTFTRVKSGNPGIMLTLNPSSRNTTVDLSGIDKVPEELTVNSLSYTSLGDNNMLPKSKVPANNITLAGRSAIAFTFVPRKEDS